MAEIFVSYTSSDREAAEWIGHELTALGHNPHLHDWEIKAGEDIYAWMERRHGEADYLLGVVSDEYLLAPFSRLELNPAIWQAGSRRPGFVLLVMVKPCKLPSIADHLRRCDLVGLPEAVMRKRFAEFMGKRDEAQRSNFPARNLAVSNIPIRIPAHFLGRDRETEALDKALTQFEDRLAIVVLHGMRGVGKSTLAAAYAERQRAKYRAVWWIRAQVEPSMAADIVQLGVRLGWCERGRDDEPDVDAVLDRLRYEGDGVLLVYDNAIDAASVRNLLPRGGRCRVIITSNAPNWRGVGATLDIGLWPEAVGADYLVARTDRANERTAAEDLSRTLGGLPLALEQAAAYCDRLGISFLEYRRRYDNAPARLLDDVRHAPREHNDGLTVARSFGLAIEEACNIHPAAEDLIILASLLAPDPIPLFLFSEARARFDMVPATSFADEELDEVVAALRSFALVARQPLVDKVDASVSTDVIEVHRLVREVALSRRPPEDMDQMRRALAAALSDVYQRADAATREQANHDKMQLLPHVLAAIGFLREDHDERSGAREMLDSMLRLVILTLQDAGAHAISADYLPSVVADFYEVQPLSGTIARLVENEATWPKIQRELLEANNYVLRYAIAEAIADAWTCARLCALFEGAGDLNEFELGGYALGLAYARDPGAIDPNYLARLASHACYPGRSILGDLFLNLSLRTGAAAKLDLRALAPSDRFWEPIWDFVELDVRMIEAADAFMARPQVGPERLQPAAANDYAVLAALEADRAAALARATNDVLRQLLSDYFSLGEDPARVERAHGALSELDAAGLRNFARLMFSHPIWSVAEAAATSLSLLVEHESTKTRERLQIISDLLDDANWRVQFGALEAAYAVRFVDRAIFQRAVANHHDHWNCKIRGLCAENLIAIILNAGADRRESLLRAHESEIRFWLMDEDCWVLEHVFRLFNTLHVRSVDARWLFSSGVSRLFDDAPEWFQFDRERFLRHIESRKIILHGA